MSTTIPPTEPGAAGDGPTDDTAAVQDAVDRAHARGGGRVVLESGRTYSCGSVELKSHVELHLEPGSRLVAATRIEDFTRRFLVGALAGGVSARSSEATGALLWAQDATDVSITGSGVVDGSAGAYVTEQDPEIFGMDNARPFPVFLIGCTRVSIRDVRFVDAALWTVRLSGCHHVTITGIRIDNDMRVPNADGIDLDHCTRVQVVGCDIRCPDDGISLKTTDEFRDLGPCEDITVTGCVIESRSTAITLGVDADCPIRNVVVTGCVIRNSHRGVSVSVGTGADGRVENVLFSDLVIETRHDVDRFWGSAEPIVIRSAPWHDEAGEIRNVRIRNVLARAENGVLIYASGGGVVTGLHIDGLRLELDRWTQHPGHRRDLRPYDGAPADLASTGLPHAVQAVRPPALHVEGAHDVLLRDVHVSRGSAEFGPALSVDRSSRVRWRDLEIDGPGAGELVIDGERRELTPNASLPADAKAL